jgi:DNA repair protein RadA/Sms
MAKIKTRYVCQECGHNEPKWAGRCPGCGEWNTLQEETVVPTKATDKPSRRAQQSRKSTKPVKLSELKLVDHTRAGTGISELDRVLGGGVVPGSVVLVGGEPGIGKSTLLLQVAGTLSREGHKVLYCSGEESLTQIGLRGKRLGVSDDDLLLITETRLEELLRQVDEVQPDILIVDSVQTLATAQISSAPGSVSQLREVTSALTQLSKDGGPASFLVGHVTKDGNIAGPKLLEHMVDTVLYFEGRHGMPFRILRAVKNRFGSTDEIGVFEMRNKGLVEIPDPSRIFLSERPDDASGSAVVCTFEGSRPLLVEVQALVSPNSYGPPRVTAIGVDTGRVLLMLNILEKRTGLKVLGHDVFVNVAGGVRVQEPAVDLGICAAIASSKLDMTIPEGVVLFGEVGLTGEVRAVGQASSRLAEVSKLGFETCVLSLSNSEVLRKEGERLPGVKLCEVKAVGDVLRELFG